MRAVFAVGGLSLLFIAAAGSAQPLAGTDDAVKAEEVYENIQALKGVPAAEIIPSMHSFSASLGVECAYCHDNEYETDKNPRKATARKMIRMMRTINENAFGGQLTVTCYSCHRGNVKPLPEPPVSSEQPKRADSEVTVEGSYPTVDQLFATYLNALGGAEAVQSITSRVAKGTITDDQGHKFPMELFIKSPDKSLSVIHPSKGTSFTLINGKVGWTITPNEAPKGRTSRDLWREDFDALRLTDPLFFVMRTKQVFNNLKVEPTEGFDGHGVYVVTGETEYGARVKLYFDVQSGMLARLVHFTKSPVGYTPTQIEYSDYRDVGKAKVPFRWTIDEPRGLQPRFVYHLDVVQTNIPIDDSKFGVPADCRRPRCSEPGEFNFGIPTARAARGPRGE